MKTELKIFITSIVIVLLCACTLLITTLLLDLPFISRYFARQLVIYLLMLIEAFVFVRIFIIVNNIRI